MSFYHTTCARRIQSNFYQERTFIKSLLISECLFFSNSEQSGWNHVLKNLNSFPNMNHMNFCEKETKNEVCCCCFSWSWRRMFFQSNFELVFMALGHILPDLILGNCVQKCISWILPIISNEPFMTQDELRTWKIILRALQILPTVKSRAVDRFTIQFLSIFGGATNWDVLSNRGLHTIYTEGLLFKFRTFLGCY